MNLRTFKCDSKKSTNYDRRQREEYVRNVVEALSQNFENGKQFPVFSSVENHIVCYNHGYQDL